MLFVSNRFDPYTALGTLYYNHSTNLAVVVATTAAGEKNRARAKQSTMRPFQHRSSARERDLHLERERKDFDGTSSPRTILSL